MLCPSLSLSTAGVGNYEEPCFSLLFNICLFFPSFYFLLYQCNSTQARTFWWREKGLEAQWIAVLYTGAGGRDQKNPSMSVLKEEIFHLPSSHWTWCGSGSRETQEMPIRTPELCIWELGGSLECSHVAGSSHSADALYPMDFLR